MRGKKATAIRRALKERGINPSQQSYNTKATTGAEWRMDEQGISIKVPVAREIILLQPECGRAMYQVAKQFLKL